jgi:hypothetical protein
MGMGLVAKRIPPKWNNQLEKSNTIDELRDVFYLCEIKFCDAYGREQSDASQHSAAVAAARRTALIMPEILSGCRPVGVWSRVINNWLGLGLLGSKNCCE